MYKIVFFVIFSFSFVVVHAQKKVARYYVEGKLLCTHTYNINSERSEISYLTVTNTLNYNGTKYTSCATCRFENSNGVAVISLQDQNFENVFKIYLRYIDKQTCILLFNSNENDENKLEIYLAKEIITDK